MEVFIEYGWVFVLVFGGLAAVLWSLGFGGGQK